MTQVRLVIERDGKKSLVYLSEDELCVMVHALTAYKPLKAWSIHHTKLVHIFQRITKGMLYDTAIPLTKRNFRPPKRSRN